MNWNGRQFTAVYTPGWLSLWIEKVYRTFPRWRNVEACYFSRKGVGALADEMLESPNERERMVSQSFGPGGSTYFIPSSKGGDSRQ